MRLTHSCKNKSQNIKTLINAVKTRLTGMTPQKLGPTETDTSQGKQ